MTKCPECRVQQESHIPNAKRGHFRNLLIAQLILKLQLVLLVMKQPWLLVFLVLDWVVEQQVV